MLSGLKELCQLLNLDVGGTKVNILKIIFKLIANYCIIKFVSYIKTYLFIFKFFVKVVIITRIIDFLRNPSEAETKTGNISINK